MMKIARKPIKNSTTFFFLFEKCKKLNNISAQHVVPKYNKVLNHHIAYNNFFPNKAGSTVPTSRKMHTPPCCTPVDLKVVRPSLPSGDGTAALQQQGQARCTSSQGSARSRGGTPYAWEYGASAVVVAAPRRHAHPRGGPTQLRYCNMKLHKFCIFTRICKTT